MKNFILINGISSEEFPNILINKLPDIQKPTKKIERVDIPGRRFPLYIDDKTHESTLKTVECTLKNTNSIYEIIEWIDSCEEVVFSDRLDRKYKARVINQIDFSRVMRQFKSFIINFECEPYSRLVDGENKVTIAEATTIFNPGAVESYPHIKIYGNGDITVYIGDDTVVLKDVSDYIEIDCQTMNCYKIVNGTQVNQNSKMWSEFPCLKKGENRISWLGNISKIEITPKWLGF